MPELAEVEFYRRRWDACVGRKIERVDLHARKRIFRDCDTRALAGSLTGAILIGSEARGKQMLFRFSGGAWLGIHLGMTGRLRVDPGPASEAVAPRQEPTRHTPAPDPRHDHLILRQAAGRLVFSDPRLFGRVRFDQRSEPPEWWRALPPSLLDRGFDHPALISFLRRRARSPIKAVLLMQERFPGIGNWMADEILWRAGVHPSTPAGAIEGEKAIRLWREIRFVARGALRSIGEEGRELPRSWLFHQRWSDDGTCPRSGVALVREPIGGRTTCWSPGVQGPAPRGRPRGR